MNIHCPNCNADASPETTHCINCKYPFHGTEQEKSSFIAQQILKSGEIKDADVALTGAKYLLWVIAMLMLLGGILADDLISMGIMGFFAVAFFTFGLLLKHGPVVFLSMAIALTSLLLLADVAAQSGINLGMLFRVGYIVGLSVSLTRVRRAIRLKKESPHL